MGAEYSKSISIWDLTFTIADNGGEIVLMVPNVVNEQIRSDLNNTLSYQKLGFDPRSNLGDNLHAYV